VLHRLDAKGDIRSSDLYDAYGKRLAGNPAADPYGYKGQFGYYTDHETGLVLCTLRYYDPRTGRWLTRDPIGYRGGVNLYVYCLNNPVNYIDPQGLWTTPTYRPPVGPFKPGIPNVNQIKDPFVPGTRIGPGISNCIPMPGITTTVTLTSAEILLLPMTVYYAGESYGMLYNRPRCMVYAMEKDFGINNPNFNPDNDPFRIAKPPVILGPQRPFNPFSERVTVCLAIGPCSLTIFASQETPEFLKPYLPPYIEALPIPDNIKISIYYDWLNFGRYFFNDISEFMLYQNNKYGLLRYADYIYQTTTNSTRPNMVAQLVTPTGRFAYGKSLKDFEQVTYEPELAPVVAMAKQQLLDSPEWDEEQGYWGKCAEIIAINEMIRKIKAAGGVVLDELRGAHIYTMYVRKPGKAEYGESKEPCELCRIVLDYFGIEYRTYPE